MHQSLFELEENLKSLESARKQVVNVASSGEKVIEAFTRILKQLEKLNEGFDANNKEVLGSFDHVVENLNASLKEDSKKRLSDNESVQRKLSEAVDSTIKKLEACNKALDEMVVSMKENNIEQAIIKIDDQQINILNDLEVVKTKISSSTNELKEHTTLASNSIDKTSKRNLIVLIAGIVLIVAMILFK